MKNAFYNFATLLVLTVFLLIYYLGLASNAKLLSDEIAKNNAVGLLVCAALFVLKCFTLFIPMGAIYAACGCLLTPWSALLICTVGNALCFSAAYYEGKSRQIKHKAFISAITENGKSGILPAFFLHCIRFFPSFTAGIYLGASGVPFWQYLLGSVLGAMPSVVISVLFGAHCFS